MSNSNALFPFGADLTDRLLTALPDFLESLQAFISSSNFIYCLSVSAKLHPSSCSAELIRPCSTTGHHAPRGVL